MIEPVTEDEVQTWVAGYLSAWRGYRPDEIAALFAQGATYAYHPFDAGEDIVRGRDAIVSNWLEQPDPPDAWTADLHPYVVSGSRAVVSGRISYRDGRGEFANLWQLDFDGEGRCSSFLEWYMRLRGT